MSENLAQALRLLRDESLVWSADFEAVRQPLADLLTLLEQTPSHQFDEAVSAIVERLETPSATVSDPMESWLVAVKGKNAAEALKNLFSSL
jgi:hypothetical protein